MADTPAARSPAVMPDRTKLAYRLFAADKNDLTRDQVIEAWMTATNDGADEILAHTLADEAITMFRTVNEHPSILACRVVDGLRTPQESR